VQKNVDTLDDWVGRMWVLYSGGMRGNKKLVRIIQEGEVEVTRCERQVKIAFNSAVNMEAVFKMFPWMETTYTVLKPDLDPSVKQRI